MESKKSLKIILSLCGFSEKQGVTTVRMYVFSLIYCILFVNLCYFFVSEWDNVDGRINAFRALTFFTTFVGYAVTYVFFWDDFYKIMNIFQKMNYKTPYKISPERMEIISSLRKTANTYNKFWTIFVVSYTGCITVVPLTILMIKIFLKPENFQHIIRENLLPYPLYYPECFKVYNKYQSLLNLSVYVIGYSMQSTFTFYTVLNAHLGHCSSLCSLANVKFELKLLRLSLLELDKCVGQKQLENQDDLDLIKFSRYFARHHQDIYRKFEEIKSGIKWIAAFARFLASFYMCMSIYTINQKEEVAAKVQELMNLSTWACAVFMLDYSGENIKTENENLKNALYECSWVNKPKWFKNILLISMVRSGKPTDIQPFGLFSFNLRSFASTINAAYSYYSLLHNFKNK